MDDLSAELKEAAKRNVELTKRVKDLEARLAGYTRCEDCCYIDRSGVFNRCAKLRQHDGKGRLLFDDSGCSFGLRRHG